MFQVHIKATAAFIIEPVLISDKQFGKAKCALNILHFSKHFEAIAMFYLILTKGGKN